MEKKSVSEIANEILDRVSDHDEMHPNSMEMAANGDFTVPCGCIEFIKEALSTERSLTEAAEKRVAEQGEEIERLKKELYHSGEDTFRLVVAGTALGKTTQNAMQLIGVLKKYTDLRKINVTVTPCADLAIQRENIKALEKRVKEQASSILIEIDLSEKKSKTIQELHSLLEKMAGALEPIANIPTKDGIYNHAKIVLTHYKTWKGKG